MSFKHVDMLGCTNEHIAEESPIYSPTILTQLCRPNVLRLHLDGRRYLGGEAIFGQDCLQSGLHGCHQRLTEQTDKVLVAGPQKVVFIPLAGINCV